MSAVVSPGYTFGTSERVTTDKLNRAANPTITITGTVGGTNANIAANSVNGAMLVNGLPGTNLTWDGSSPRKLVLANAGVGTNQISEEIAGLGLTGGTGAPLRVSVDTNTVTITNDVVTLNLTTFSNLVNVLAYYQVTNNVVTNGFTTAEFALATGVLTNTAHGMSATPGGCRLVLVCKTADGGFVPNDELDSAHAGNNNAVFSLCSNGTNVIASWTGQSPNFARKDTGAEFQPNIAGGYWKGKLYVRP